MTAADIRVLDDPVRAFADVLLEAAASGGHVALTGGSSPKTAYELAAKQAGAFAGAHIWFGDERCVAPDDERSNYRMARLALLDRLTEAGVELGGCHRMQGELGPHAGAEAYLRELQREADDPRGPVFELILLGIGPDTHICSMFPGQPSVVESERLVVGVEEAGFEPYVPRITMTFPQLSRARRVVLMATGSGKADAVGRAFGTGAAPGPDRPASLLLEHAASLTVLLDADAAAQL